jgi:hypothetical protein
MIDGGVSQILMGLFQFGRLKSNDAHDLHDFVV